MAVFYLLPPRPFLGEHCAALLHDFFPGLDWDTPGRMHFADALGAALAGRSDVFVVYRDDLPCGEAPARALIDGFGAEVGDVVVEVRPGGEPGKVTSRRWRLA